MSGKDLSISPPQAQVFLSAPAKSQSVCFGSLFGGGPGPCPLAGWPVAGLWEVTGTREERDQMAGWTCGVRQPAKAAGLKLHPGRWLQPRAGLPAGKWSSLTWAGWEGQIGWREMEKQCSVALGNFIRHYQAGRKPSTVTESLFPSCLLGWVQH